MEAQDTLEKALKNRDIEEGAGLEGFEGFRVLGCLFGGLGVEVFGFRALGVFGFLGFLLVLGCLLVLGF